MKKIFPALLTILFILYFSLSSISAQQLKIGIFDLQQIMRESDAVKGYRDIIVRDVNTKKGQINQKQEWIKSIEERLKKEDKAISPEDRKALSDKLGTEIRELKRMREDAEIEYQKMNRELTERTIKEIAAIVSKLAKTEGYVLILERSSAGIAYMDGMFDITEKIIAQLK